MPLGTGGALYLAAQQIPHADWFLVMNGDSYCHMQLHAFVQAHRRNRAANSMVVTALDDMRRFGSVQFDEQGFIRGFREKDPAVRRDGAGLINAGVYIVSRALIESIPPRPERLFGKRDFSSLSRWTASHVEGEWALYRYRDAGIVCRRQWILRQEAPHERMH